MTPPNRPLATEERAGTDLGPSLSYPYSPECLGDAVCELRQYGVLVKRSVQHTSRAASKCSGGMGSRSSSHLACALCDVALLMALPRISRGSGETRGRRALSDRQPGGSAPRERRRVVGSGLYVSGCWTVSGYRSGLTGVSGRTSGASRKPATFSSCSPWHQLTASTASRRWTCSGRT